MATPEGTSPPTQDPSEQQGLFARGMAKIAEIAANPQVHEKLHFLGSSTLEGMGVVSADEQTGKLKLDTSGAIEALKTPRDSAVRFGKEFGQAVAGEAAQHAGRESFNKVFSRFVEQPNPK